MITFYSIQKANQLEQEFSKKSIVNTSSRKSFIYKDLIPKIKEFEKVSKINVHISGMPYVRTLNSQNIIDEIEIFIIAAILITSLIFFFFLVIQTHSYQCLL